jgi:hypothetical protein
MSKTPATRSKRQPKAVQYAKYAEVGDWVHAKGIHVTSDANLNRWYGSKGSSKYFSGIVQEKFLNEIITGRREWWITAQFDLPGGESTTKSNKAIFHYPQTLAQAREYVDLWYDRRRFVDIYKGCTGGNQLNQAAYYKALLDALIDEPLKTQPETRRTSMSTTSSGESVSTSVCSSGMGMHLTPTKRIAPDTVSSSGRRMQIKCRLCLQKTTWVCSLCHEDPNLGDIGAAYCHPKSGRVCYQRHMYEWHM